MQVVVIGVASLITHSFDSYLPKSDSCVTVKALQKSRGKIQTAPTSNPAAVFFFFLFSTASGWQRSPSLTGVGSFASLSVSSWHRSSSSLQVTFGKPHEENVQSSVTSISWCATFQSSSVMDAALGSNPRHVLARLEHIS